MAARQFATTWNRWEAYLSTPVDGASLGFFRLCFGFLVAWDALRFLSYGWVDEYFVLPTVHFTYPFFSFVQPWPAPWMHAHFWLLAMAGLLVGVGLFYRTAIVVLFVAYAYFFLLEASIYMNHYYLIALLAFLMVWMPADRDISLRRRISPATPSTVPRWTVFLLRFQLFVMYFFGGIAKLNHDWLHGEPMYSALVRGGPDLPPGAHLFPPSLLSYGIAYAGITIDLAVPILLSMRRTRRLGFALAIPFHVLNEAFLRIGIFSYLALSAITIFLDPDWPRRFLGRRLDSTERHRTRSSTTAPLLFIHLYMAIQILFPLRHFAYPGNVSWSEEGHRFAWHMKLREKRCRMRITATDKDTHRQWEIDPNADLRPRQVRKLQTFPDILLQYVHHHRQLLRARGVAAEIRVDWECSLNGRPFQKLVDPSRDLAAVEATLGPADWIVPLPDD